MKKLFILLLICMFGATLSSKAQSEKYVAAMKKNIAMGDTAVGNASTMLAVSNSMERIALAEKTQWLPYYYAALYKLNAVFATGNFQEGDNAAEVAEKFANRADSLSPNNSEISVLRAMISTVRMLVNPQARFMQEGMAIQSHLDLAIKQDPNNPRPNYMKAENLKGTPEQFGGGCKAASNDLEQALAKYAKFTIASDIMPNWGKERTEMLAKECK